MMISILKGGLRPGRGKKSAASLQGGTQGLTSAYCSLFSQGWLATPQLVLQADWQEVWHSPQPPVVTLLQRSRVSMVLILSMVQVSNRFILICAQHSFSSIQIKTRTTDCQEGTARQSVKAPVNR